MAKPSLAVMLMSKKHRGESSSDEGKPAKDQAYSDSFEEFADVSGLPTENREAAKQSLKNLIEICINQYMDDDEEEEEY